MPPPSSHTRPRTLHLHLPPALVPTLDRGQPRTSAAATALVPALVPVPATAPTLTTVLAAAQEPDSVPAPAPVRELDSVLAAPVPCPGLATAPTLATVPVTARAMLPATAQELPPFPVLELPPVPALTLAPTAPSDPGPRSGVTTAASVVARGPIRRSLSIPAAPLTRSGSSRSGQRFRGCGLRCWRGFPRRCNYVAGSNGKRFWHWEFSHWSPSDLPCTISGTVGRNPWKCRRRSV